MKYRIIRVYENDYDYNYEQLFLVKCSEEQKQDLFRVLNKLDEMDEIDSKIDYIENYIMKNYDVIKTDLVELNCY